MSICRKFNYKTFLMSAFDLDIAPKICFIIKFSTKFNFEWKFFKNTLHFGSKNMPGKIRLENRWCVVIGNIFHGKHTECIVLNMFYYSIERWRFIRLWIKMIPKFLTIVYKNHLVSRQNVVPNSSSWLGQKISFTSKMYYNCKLIAIIKISKTSSFATPVACFFCVVLQLIMLFWMVFFDMCPHVVLWVYLPANGTWKDVFFVHFFPGFAHGVTLGDAHKLKFAA